MFTSIAAGLEIYFHEFLRARSASGPGGTVVRFIAKLPLIIFRSFLAVVLFARRDTANREIRRETVRRTTSRSIAISSYGSLSSL